MRRQRRTERKRFEQSFSEFAKGAWPVLEPGHQLVWNWHHDLICNYLDAFSRREFRRLVINIPPRCTKSILISVLYPAWKWATDPRHQFLTLSHRDDLAIRDAVKSRNLIQTPWYQGYWSDAFKFSGDQNQKSRYQNNHFGHRIAMGITAGATGEGGDTILIDDAHDSESAQSDAERANVIEAYTGKIITRLNDQRSGGIIIIGQRLHEMDLPGYVLSHEEGWEHLCLPMRFDPALSKSTYKPAGSDPRKKAGELLDLVRFPLREVNSLEHALGPYKTGGQHQQDPTPAIGGILPKNQWRLWPKGKDIPECIHVFASWDTAYTARKQMEAEKANQAARSACTLWGVFKDSDDDRKLKLILLYAWADWCDYHDLLEKAKEIDKEWKPDATLVEKKATGISLVQDMRREGLPVKSYDPGFDGDKVARAYSAQPMLFGGQIYYPDRRWAEEVIEEVGKFPKGARKDYADSCTQAWLYVKRGLYLLAQDVKKPLTDENTEDLPLPRAAAYG